MRGPDVTKSPASDEVLAGLMASAVEVSAAATRGAGAAGELLQAALINSSSDIRRTRGAIFTAGFIEAVLFLFTIQTNPRAFSKSTCLGGGTLLRQRDAIPWKLFHDPACRNVGHR